MSCLNRASASRASRAERRSSNWSVLNWSGSPRLAEQDLLPAYVFAGDDVDVEHPLDPVDELFEGDASAGEGELDDTLFLDEFAADRAGAGFVAVVLFGAVVALPVSLPEDAQPAFEPSDLLAYPREFFLDRVVARAPTEHELALLLAELLDLSLDGVEGALGGGVASAGLDRALVPLVVLLLRVRLRGHAQDGRACGDRRRQYRAPHHSGPLLHWHTLRPCFTHVRAHACPALVRLRALGSHAGYGKALSAAHAGPGE